jgi:sulfhydrogenase subunit alpha
MSACHAMERACGVNVDGPLRELRRLLYCGEWIQSHALHVYMLHAPDFLGADDAVAIARQQPEIVRRGLALRGVGNDLIACLGGRSVAPVNVRVGGFYRLPSPAELAALVDPLQRARDAAVATVRWVAGFDFPALEHDYEFVALAGAERYPMNEGRLRSSRGLDIEQGDFEAHFEERQVPHSTALHARRIGGGSYFTGPMARYALNAPLLSPLVQELAREAGLGEVCRNPYQSIIVRALEIVEACEEALRLIDGYEPPAAAALPVAPRAGVGCAITEAPRGILYHRYEVAADGSILAARIVPPTSQNQATIEADLRRVLEANAGLSDADLGWRCEQTIRNYDPCISCATHFLQLKVRRT